MRVSRLLPLAGALAVACAVGAVAQQPRPGDWPQFRGPNRDGLSRETGLLKQWPATGPKAAWKASGLGGGYGAVSVAGGRVYGMGHRGPEESVWCLDAASGNLVWATPIAQANRRGKGYGDGTRCTPTVDGANIYVLGDSGDAACLETATGRLKWKKDLVTDFGGGVPHWGYSESPLVDGNKVIYTPGGAQNTLVALDKATGNVIWRSQLSQGNGAQYCSPIVATVGGVRQYITFLQGGLAGFSAQDGRFLWGYTNPANGTANISSPVFREPYVFAATAYNTGGGLAKLTAANGAVSAQEVYFTRRMQNHHGGMVLVGDYLYGFDNANLTCLDFMTGEVKWSDRSVGKGSVVFADGMIYARSERGPVALVEATPTAYTERGRFDQPERSAKNAWAHPVVANGRLYLRDQDNLFVYEVK
jgi:outer membrane protein assembly factor BamB